MDNQKIEDNLIALNYSNIQINNMGSGLIHIQASHVHDIWGKQTMRMAFPEDTTEDFVLSKFKNYG